MSLIHPVITKNAEKNRFRPLINLPTYAFDCLNVNRGLRLEAIAECRFFFRLDPERVPLFYFCFCGSSRPEGRYHLYDFSKPQRDIINQKHSWEFRARASEVYDFAAT
ncbi:hypothetical protein MTP99_011976 [Tenebrio molitor]|nr:hypothetical protein MTP99_011976 [Tenebrio molitor]